MRKNCKRPRKKKPNRMLEPKMNFATKGRQVKGKKISGWYITNNFRELRDKKQCYNGIYNHIEDVS